MVMDRVWARLPAKQLLACCKLLCWGPVPAAAHANAATAVLHSTAPSSAATCSFGAPFH